MPRERTLARENGSRLAMANTLSLSSRNTATWRPPIRAQTPVFGTISSSRQTATQSPFAGGDGGRETGDRSPALRGSSFILHPSSFSERRFALVGSSRPYLPALGDEHDVAVGLVAVDEVAEALERFRVVDRLFPLALVGVHESLHVGLELGAEAEGVLAHDLA